MPTPDDATRWTWRRSMRTFAGEPSLEDVARVRDFSPGEVLAALTAADIESEALREVARHWDEFRRDETWVDLLASVFAMIQRQRGDLDAPVPIWPDLDAAGVERSIFLLLSFCTVCREHARDIHEPAHSERSDRAHDEYPCASQRYARSEYGTVGVETGWWLIPTLRAERLHIGYTAVSLRHRGRRHAVSEPLVRRRRSGVAGTRLSTRRCFYWPAYSRGTDFNPASLDRHV